MTEIAERLHDHAKAAGPGHEICGTTGIESSGVKFIDAQLLGMYLYLIVTGAFDLAAGGVEVTERATGERRRSRSKTSRRCSVELELLADLVGEDVADLGDLLLGKRRAIERDDRLAALV